MDWRKEAHAAKMRARNQETFKRRNAALAAWKRRAALSLGGGKGRTVSRKTA